MCMSTIMWFILINDCMLKHVLMYTLGWSRWTMNTSRPLIKFALSHCASKHICASKDHITHFGLNSALRITSPEFKLRYYKQIIEHINSLNARNCVHFISRNIVSNILEIWIGQTLHDQKQGHKSLSHFVLQHDFVAQWKKLIHGKTVDKTIECEITLGVQCL